ncbi:MAG: transglycosylase domain-containing protein [Candidatus Riflebacteria bacterium]|nr:transglycosylase domain-containing protein [Candidatus Riflebacteria bacterium]
MKLKVIKIIIFFAFLLSILWFGRETIAEYVVSNPIPPIEEYFSSGGAYTDCNGRLLRSVANKRGDFLFPVKLRNQSKELIEAVITAEDRNFRAHPGFDLGAIIRAAIQNLKNGRVVSGASTITQQVIRIAVPRERTFTSKFAELFGSILVEAAYSKDEILERYLNSVCLFGNVRGTAMAALLLFGKDSEMLNLAESAALAAAIQAPGRYNPFTKKGNLALLDRRNRILRDMLKLGKCSESEYKNALKEIIPTYRKKRAFNAPHFCDYLESKYGKPVGTLETTIDLNIQNSLALILKSHLPRLARQGATQAAAMIVDAKTAEVKALCGSAEYGPISGGFNNASIAPRSGGSVLKPFLYALAFEKGYFPSYTVSDTMQPFKTPRGDYLPENAQRKNYGPVSIRMALGNSLNVSAVKMLNRLGVSDFYEFLVELGILEHKERGAETLGLGLAIGNPEIRMTDLAEAFGIFGNAGVLKTLKFFKGQKQIAKEIISKESAYMIFDILSDPSARLLTFGNPSFFKFSVPTAIKTGTSTAYRDCWLLGHDQNFISVIWVGNFNGQPTRGLTGATACGPIYKDIYNIKHEKKTVSGQLNKGSTEKRVICAVSGLKPSAFCKLKSSDLFVKSEYEKISECHFHKITGNYHMLNPEYAGWLEKRKKNIDADPFKLNFDNNAGFADNLGASIKIVSPHEGDRFVYSAFHGTPIMLRAIPSRVLSEIVWFVNGVELERTPPPYETIWYAEKGAHIITAYAEGAIASQITVMVE